MYKTDAAILISSGRLCLHIIHGIAPEAIMICESAFETKAVL